jgi:proline iminopeptidase
VVGRTPSRVRWPISTHWGLERVVVAGHSWGATLALHYALVHPRHVQGILYLSGTGIDPAWRAAYHVNRKWLQG